MNYEEQPHTEYDTVSDPVPMQEEPPASDYTSSVQPESSTLNLRRFFENLSPAARGFVLTFMISAVVLLLVAGGILLYQRGKKDSLEENGTYADGYAAALEERGTYQEGWDAALRENGTYADGYSAGLAKGQVEGYEKGHADGLRDAVTEENIKKQEEAASQAQNPSSEPTKDDSQAQSQQVWVPRILGSRYHTRKNCPLLIDPVETTREQAVADGYKACKKCAK